MLLDYTEPGLFDRFVDEGAINKLERRVARKGYLDGADIAGTFNALRANDLIFSYVVSNWLARSARRSAAGTYPARR